MPAPRPSKAASVKVSGATEVMKAPASASRALGGRHRRRGKLNGVVAGLFAVLAGGEIFEKAIEATTTYTGEVNKLSKAFGITLGSGGRLSTPR
jgi:hypothetical protein